MKKITSIVLILCIALGAVFSIAPSAEAADKWDGTVGDGFDGGTGTKENPYLIGSGKALAYLAQTVNSSTGERNAFTGKYFKLTNSIDLNNHPWCPIGYLSVGGQSTSSYFGGVFDGAGYCIYNLNVSVYQGADGSANVLNCGTGLFGVVQTDAGMIRNLGIESGTVTTTGGMAGAIVGILSGKAVIDNCYSKATVVMTVAGSKTMYAKAGGIVGQVKGLDCTVSNCVNYGIVSSLGTTGYSGECALGGICGDIGWNKDPDVITATFENCYFAGALYAVGHTKAGAVLGTQRNARVTVTNCKVGGIIGGSAASADLQGAVIGYYSEGGTYTYRNITVYRGDFTGESLTYQGKTLQYPDRIVGVLDKSGAAELDDAVCTSPESIVVPCADQESFLVATERAVELARIVREGSALIDGSVDEAYRSSCRLLDYTSGNNALSDEIWTGAQANIYAMADYQYLYLAVEVTDSDVVIKGNAKDLIWFQLSFDQSQTIFSVEVDAGGAVNVKDTDLGNDIRSEVSNLSNGYVAELAIPVGELLRYNSLGLSVQVQDASADGQVRCFSGHATGDLGTYPLSEIHGRPGVGVTAVAFAQNEFHLVLGQTVLLNYTISPADAYDRSVKYESSAPDVVKVDEMGKITASTVGEAVITVTAVDGGYQDSCRVVVSEIEVSGVSLSANEFSLSVGRRKMLACTVTPENAENKAVMWSSSAPEVAVVSENGLVTGVGPGEAIITVTTESGGYTATCRVAVISHLTDLQIGKTQYEMQIGDEEQIVLTILPGDANDTTWTWSSDAPAVCTVDENGVLRAVGVGEAAITLTTDNGMIERSCRVTVTQRASAQPDAADTDTSVRTQKGCRSQSINLFVVMIGVGAWICVLCCKRKGEER